MTPRCILSVKDSVGLVPYQVIAWQAESLAQEWQITLQNAPQEQLIFFYPLKTSEKRELEKRANRGHTIYVYSSPDDLDFIDAGLPS